MSFCAKCGTARVPGSNFCTVCGAAQPPAEPLGQPSAAMPTPAAQPAFTPVPGAYATGNAPVPGAKKSNTLLKVIIAVLVILFIGAGLALAGLYYAAQKVKEKVHSVTAQVLSGVPPSAGAPSSPGSTPPPAAASSFPGWRPSSAATPNVNNPAPAKAGMLVVTAIASERGDYESMKQIVSIDDRGITLSYHSEGPKLGTAGGSNSIAVERLVLAQDLNTAHDYAEVFNSNAPRSFPGTTAITASREVLTELKQNGSSAFSFRPQGLAGALGSLVGTFSALTGTDTKNVGGVSLDKLGKKVCSLQREGNGLYAFPVLLNAQPVTLPALRATCTTDDGRADFYILDQPDYPLMLAWKLGEGSQLQVIKITYPPSPASQKSNQPAPPSAIEQQLKENKKVDIYGIYFDFASDQLKPESTPVLEEIAGVLKDNPEWKLTVSGHTDNVGGDAYNLDLSKRRAAAVKQALVTQYQVAPERLSTDGFGASRPVDSNDTLAGRARNRRVELTRE
jgi:outer membrane protein OmpA-like peptidoglycan-associated protein/preprotein translocase subunit SecG